MVAAAIAGNISAEATTPTGNIFAEAMRGARECPLPAQSLRCTRPIDHRDRNGAAG
jgi:hypothetical protein